MMRKHLHLSGWLLGRQDDVSLNLFPRREIRNLMNKTELLSVDCECRMPEEEVQSNSCKEWFQKGCVHGMMLLAKAWKDKDFCSSYITDSIHS